MASFILQKKTNYTLALVPRIDCDRQRIHFDIIENPTEKRDLSAGTVGGANAECLVCGQATSAAAIKTYGQSVGLGHRLIAVAVRDGKGKRFRTVTSDEAQRALNVPQPIPFGDSDAVPNEPMPPKGTLGFRVQNYGFKTWGSIYNPRQALALATFSRHIRSIEPEIRAAVSGFGNAAAEPADDLAAAVTTYLGLCVSKLADFCSTITVLHSHGSPRPGHTFRMQTVPMTWDYLEINPISDGAASWTKITSDIDATISRLAFPGHAHVRLASADCLPFESCTFDAIITDPPYYDAIPYSDLSDYFYIWLRRMLTPTHPSIFSTELAPKRSEIVQNPAHNKSAEFYERGMSRAFCEIHRTLKDSGIVVLVFAHKSTAAWERLLTALNENDLIPSASWPIETESPGRMRAHGSSALASSIFLVCRKRRAIGDGFVDDVESQLNIRLHERLDYFWTHGIRGADFFMSAIGPAIEVFGSHKQVLRLSGEQVSIGDLLRLTRKIVANYAIERLAGSRCAQDIDGISQFYLIWRWAYGTAEVESGEAIHLAQSMGLEFTSLTTAFGLLSQKSEKVYLKGPIERRKIDNLGTPKSAGVCAPCIDVLHRATAYWAAGKVSELTDFLSSALPQGNYELMLQLAQSLVDVLPPCEKERSIYETFLVGARSLRVPDSSVDTSPSPDRKPTVRNQKAGVHQSFTR
ncbi:MAG: hypothetical protein FWD57_09870 [Polyangiaceae bacterium]|nr:hypothetical protein [Polyangiaceae bacterium]